MDVSFKCINIAAEQVQADNSNEQILVSWFLLFLSCNQRLSQGYRNPVLKGRNPTTFSDLPVENSSYLVPHPFFLIPGRTENLAGSKPWRTRLPRLWSKQIIIREWIPWCQTFFSDAKLLIFYQFWKCVFLSNVINSNPGLSDWTLKCHQCWFACILKNKMAPA